MFDGFVTEDDEGGHGSESLGKGLVAGGLADALDDLLTA